MDRTKRGSRSVADLQTALGEIGLAIGAMADVLSQAAREKRFADAPAEAGATADPATIAANWSAAADALAVQVARVAARVDGAMASLEEPPQLTPKERLIAGFKALAAMNRRRAKRRPADMLEAALADADALYGALTAHRALLVATRPRSEADLVALAGERGSLTDATSETTDGAEDPDPRDAVQQFEDRLQTAQDFVVELNRQLAATHVLTGKLTIETERAILLADILSPRQKGAGADAGPVDRARYPQLAPLLDLHDGDMLSSVETERRKPRIDARFVEMFHDTLDKRPAGSYV